MRTVPRSPVARYRVVDGRMVFAGELGAWPAGTAALLPPLADRARLIAAASGTYRPALPLAHLLPAVARAAADPRSHGWTVIAIAMGMFNGYVRPKHERKR